MHDAAREMERYMKVWAACTCILSLSSKTYDQHGVAFVKE